MDWTIYSLTFLFTFILSSQFIFLVFTRVFPKPNRSDFFSLFFLSLGLGPVIIALLTKISIDFFPYPSEYLYTVSIIAFFLILFLFNFNQIERLFGIYKELFSRIKQAGFLKDKLKCTMLVIIIGVYGLIYVQATRLPIIGADPIKFAYYAKHAIAERLDTPEKIPQKNHDAYQTLRGILGKHYPTTGLYLWFFLTNHPKKADLLCRTVTPFYYLFLMIIIGYLLWSRGEWTVLWGILLFSFIPYLVSQTIGNSQDPGNLFLLMLTLAWLAYAIREKKVSYFITLMVILILAVFAARINYLLIYFCFTSILVLMILRLKRRKLVLWVLIGTLLTVFFAVDIINIGTGKNNKLIIEKSDIQTANNYRANREILNDINKYKGNHYLQLLIKKTKIFTNLFNDIHFNYYAILAIIAISFWIIYVRDKNTIEVILSTAILSYLFLIAFNDNNLFLFSNVYRAKIRSNEFFLLYIRYLFPLIVMLVIFNAIFIAQMTRKLSGKVSRPIVVILALIFLFIPVKGRLLNHKQSLGIDDWKKIFTASENQKLFSYRNDYGKIIKFIRTSVRKNEKILTPTIFKFIPYYSNRQCIDSKALGKKILEKDPEYIYRKMRAKGITYILPTDKFRLFSYLEPPIDDILNNPSLTYIIYDSKRWRMYKLRKKIKPFNEKLVKIPNGRFLALDGNKPRAWNCTIPENENWGIINHTENSRIILLNNIRDKKRRFYTGSGEYKLSPSHYNDYSYQINSSTYYKLRWSGKVSRPIQLKVWFLEYDHEGKMKRNLTKVMLSTKFREKSATFYTDENTKEYRILFQLSDVTELYLKDITLSELKSDT